MNQPDVLPSRVVPYSPLNSVLHPIPKHRILAAFHRRVTTTSTPPPVKPPLFANVPEDDLLGYGVPPEWLGDVTAATEDTLLALADHLPQEASEALLEIATGMST